ncbi:MAG: DNA-directed RNA polymerase subunit omega [Thermoleophilia bacterium]|nr:DNA-directed RNA polymerase subunit omega [Thermoleophilia bacterium]
MLYGRRLDEALEHVDGSRYALVHAVSKRARQITLWLTADPAELRAEDAPPPAAGELVTRDPVALSEAEILRGEVRVRWNPDGVTEDHEALTGAAVEDELLLDGLSDDDDEGEVADDDANLTPALSQVLEGDAAEAAADDADEEEAGDDPQDEDLGEASLENLQEQELNDDSDEEDELD